MFYLEARNSKGYKIYGYGDEVPFKMKNGARFEGIYKKVTELGLVEFVGLILKGRDVIDTGGSLKIPVGDIIPVSGGVFTLLDPKCVRLRLKAVRAKVTFYEGDSLVLSISNTVSSIRYYEAEYRGIKGNNILLSNCKIVDKLGILNDKKGTAYYAGDIEVPVSSIVFASFKSNPSHKYIVKIARERIH